MVKTISIKSLKALTKHNVIKELKKTKTDIEIDVLNEIIDKMTIDELKQKGITKHIIEGEGIKDILKSSVNIIHQGSKKVLDISKKAVNYGQKYLGRRRLQTVRQNKRLIRNNEEFNAINNEKKKYENRLKEAQNTHNKEDEIHQQKQINKINKKLPNTDHGISPKILSQIKQEERDIKIKNAERIINDLLEEYDDNDIEEKTFFESTRNLMNIYPELKVKFPDISKDIYKDFHPVYESENQPLNKFQQALQNLDNATQGF